MTNSRSTRKKHIKASKGKLYISNTIDNNAKGWLIYNYSVALINNVKKLTLQGNSDNGIAEKIQQIAKLEKHSLEDIFKLSCSFVVPKKPDYASDFFDENKMVLNKITIEGGKVNASSLFEAYCIDTEINCESAILSRFESSSNKHIKKAHNCTIKNGSLTSDMVSDSSIESVDLNNGIKVSNSSLYDCLCNGGVFERCNWRDNGICVNSTWNGGTWYDGIWRGGVWESGTWLGGQWHSGTWKVPKSSAKPNYDGVPLQVHSRNAAVDKFKASQFNNGNWWNGVWEGGIFNKSTWGKGKWEDGVWIDSEWHRGLWLDGTFNGGTWRGGTWTKGTWSNGDWLQGKWHNGTFSDGEFSGGIWKNGIFQGGTFSGGVWEDGIWEGGEWEGGTWKGGYDINGNYHDKNDPPSNWVFEKEKSKKVKDKTDKAPKKEPTTIKYDEDDYYEHLTAVTGIIFDD